MYICVLGSGKILSRTNHCVTIGDREVEMAVQPCPPDVAAKYADKDPPVMIDAHDDHASMQTDVNEN